MEKTDFCTHLINEVDDLLSFIRDNGSLFYDGITEENFNKVEGNDYFPPRTAQYLAVSTIHAMLFCVMNTLNALHENCIFPDKKF